MRASDEFEPIFVARSGLPVTVSPPHEGTPFATVNEDANQYLFHTDLPDFDPFYGTLRNKAAYTEHFHQLLAAYQPEVVHFQHTFMLGYDLITLTRNTLPNAPIVYTLHEFGPICHRDGQMVRTRNQELCRESSPRRCHECFPERSPQSFFRRKRFIQAHLSQVDLFLAPSHFLLERYVDWGIPPEKLRFEDIGHRAANWKLNQNVNREDERPRNRLGFFGQFNPYKGVNVLLEAVRILSEDYECDVHLRLHGSNLQWQPEAYQDEFESLLQASKPNVALVGRYDHDELSKLMSNIDWVVVPSIWWENAPLVIQEAFIHGKPVICSDIGGMAEKVTHGVNGLHFRVGDPVNLAETICEAVNSQGLWERLRGGIPEVYKIEDSAATLSEVYRTLLDRTPAKK